MAIKDGSRLRLSYNAPVVLSFALVCVAVQLVNALTNGGAAAHVFSVGRPALSLNPLTWFRLLLHVAGHADWGHLLNNMMFILILGPMIEEKYGSMNTLFVILATALITGLVYTVFFPGSLILGASGVVFAFIILASITGFREHTIPLTFLLVAALYIGQQIYNAVTEVNNVSELTHIVGGVTGGALGFVMRRGHMDNYHART